MYLKQKCGNCSAEFEVEDDDKGVVRNEMKSWEEKHGSICNGVVTKISLQGNKGEQHPRRTMTVLDKTIEL